MNTFIDKNSICVNLRFNMSELRTIIAELEKKKTSIEEELATMRKDLEIQEGHRMDKPSDTPVVVIRPGDFATPEETEMAILAMEGNVLAKDVHDKLIKISNPNTL